MKCIFLVLLIVGYSSCYKLSENKYRDDFFKKYSAKNADQRIFTDLRSIIRSDGKLRIFGGTEVEPHSLPFQVAILVNLPYNQKSFCGGTLISDHVILTAARCLDKALNATIILGAHDLLDPTEETFIIEVGKDTFLVNKGWKGTKGNKNDIALIKLNLTIPMSETIQPIALPDALSAPVDDVEGTISGWGYFNTSHLLSQVLQSANALIIDNTACQAYYGRDVQLTNICLDGSQGQTSCTGDIGGPLFIENGDEPVQVGIASFGSTNGCDKYHPTVYTRITSYLDWIQANADMPAPVPPCLKV